MSLRQPSQVFSPVSLLAWGYAMAVHAQGVVQLPATLAAPTAVVTRIASGYGLCEGPVVDAAGNLYFSEPPKGNVWKVAPDGTVTRWRSGVDTPNGMELDADGHVVCCENERLSLLGPDGSVLTALVVGAYGKFNDLSIGPDGGIYFTNTGSNVYFRSPAGTLITYCCFSQSNGIEWLPECHVLYVNEYDAGRVVRYPVSDDGTVDMTKGRTFKSIDGVDGLTVDERYNVYICSYDGRVIQVFDSSGTAVGTIRVGTGSYLGVTNCVFGGPQGRTLFITSYGAVYKTELLVAGRKRGATTALEGVHRAGAKIGARQRAANESAGLTCTASGRVLNPAEAMSVKRSSCRGLVFEP